MPLILRAVRRAQGKTGAKHVAFLGGSGGGFAALRASAMVPGSMAFVQEPQTNIAAYYPSVVDRYFNTVWPNWDYTELLKAFPERFGMVRHYTDRQPDNFVYYVQSRGAPRHLEKHYMPFAEAHGASKRSGSNRLHNRVFVLYEGDKPGHGKITAREFDHYYADAMKGWRAFRAGD